MLNNDGYLILLEMLWILKARKQSETIGSRVTSDFNACMVHLNKLITDTYKENWK